MPDPFTVADWRITPTPAGLSVTLATADGRTVELDFPLYLDADTPADAPPHVSDFAADLDACADQWAFDADS